MSSPCCSTQCDAERAEVIANHLLASALGGNHGRSGAFSVTIGISAFPDPSADRHQIIHHADAALYAGKRHGRTNVQRFDPSKHGIAEDSRSLAQLEAAVVRVASEDLLRAVYQPIYSLTTGGIIGFEGLVRPAEESGFSGATSLFVAAEATRRTVELDVVCARAVLAGAGALGDERYLSINLSPRTLESDAFSVQEILALARRHGVPASQLVIELTERESVDDLQRLQQAISTLRRNDVRVAIDDVGAGNAGLAPAQRGRVRHPEDRPVARARERDPWPERGRAAGTRNARPKPWPSHRRGGDRDGRPPRVRPRAPL